MSHIAKQLWTWYTQVLQTRLMTKAGWIVIIQTRWHEDDLVGRLTDPRNPCFTEQRSQKVADHRLSGHRRRQRHPWARAGRGSLARTLRQRLFAEHKNHRQARFSGALPGFAVAGRRIVLSRRLDAHLQADERPPRQVQAQILRRERPRRVYSAGTRQNLSLDRGRRRRRPDLGDAGHLLAASGHANRGRGDGRA